MFGKKHIAALVFFSLLFCFPSYSQLAVSGGIGMTPLQMVQNFLLGNGITVSNVKFNDSPNTISISNQIGSFSTGNTPTNLGFSSGLTIATGGVQVATSGTLDIIVNGLSISTDSQLQLLKPGKALKDVARLEFDFIPSSDSIKFRYVFASNEYLTAVCTNYDDVFGFFISGPNPVGGNYVDKNIALIPGTGLPVSINTINGGVSMGSATPCYLNYSQYYHSFIPNITYRGATIPLTATAKVVPCSTYHIKIAICDVSNNIYDSGVFLEANSFSSSQLAVSKSFTNPAISDSFMVRGCNNAIIKFKLPNPLNYNYPIPLIKQGSAINGVDYPSIPDTIFIPANTDSILLTINPFNGTSFNTPKILKLLVKTAACYYDTLSINILPNLPLQISTTGDTVICKKNNGVPISVAGNGGIPPYLFTWSNGDTNTHQIVNPLITTNYKVILKDKCNQTTKDSVIVTIYPQSTLNISANPDTICLGQTSQLNITGAQRYIWTSNIYDPSLSIQDTLYNPIVKPLLTTYYKVTAEDNHTCKSQDSVRVIVYPALHPTIFASPNPVSILDPTVHFISSSNGATSWLWNTGDGFTSNLNEFYHTYDNSDIKNYHITLTVNNTNGCSDSASVEVLIFPETKIYIPNAFTPDYPSLNNTFKAYGEGIAKFELFIYNRWGQLIFSSSNMDFGWDGKYLNDKAPIGVYVYTVNYQDIYGRVYNKTGSITLIR